MSAPVEGTQWRPMTVPRCSKRVNRFHLASGLGMGATRASFEMALAFVGFASDLDVRSLLSPLPVDPLRIAVEERGHD